MAGAARPAVECALDYLRGGLSVIPVRADGSKAPALDAWKKYQAAPASEAEVAWWFGTAERGVAVLGGAVSGNLFILDFEFPDFAAEWANLVEAEEPGLVGCLPQVLTPGKAGQPGKHVYARGPAPVPCSKLALLSEAEAKARTGDPNRRTAIEVKGEGGYVLAPGCPPACHESGRSYAHVGGPFLEEAPALTQAQVDLLLSCARALDRAPAASAGDFVGRKKQGSPAQDRPGDVFNLRGSWEEDVLLPHGWAVVRRKDGVLYLRRPGKAKGVSATAGFCTGEQAGDLLCVFSSNAGPLAVPPGKGHECYSKFAAFALLNHAGDFRAAAADLARRGFGWDAGMSAAEQLAWSLGEAVPDVADEAAWEAVRTKLARRNAEEGWGLSPDEVALVVEGARRQRVEHDPKLLALEVQRDIDESAGCPERPTPQEPRKGPKWHLVVLESNPPAYLLRAPFWSGRPKVAPNGGYIRLTVKQLSLWPGLRDAALAQADVRPPDKIAGWPRLLQRLLDNAEHRQEPNESRAELVVADFVAGHLRAARPVKEDEDGTIHYGQGSPKRLKGGLVIVKLRWLQQQADYGNHGFGRAELLECFARFGMKPKQVGGAHDRSRWWGIRPAQLEAMVEATLNGDGAEILPADPEAETDDDADDPGGRCEQ